MSISVELAGLAEQIETFGPIAYVITTSSDGRPHVVCARVAWDGDTLVMGAGRTTLANVGVRPDVALLWPAPSGSGYALIVDGKATPLRERSDPTLAVGPTAAVLHRTPGGDQASPSCVTVLSRS